MDMKKPGPGKSTIYAEIRQERVFDRPEAELAVVLLRTGDVLQHGIERVLAPFGISHAQFNALRILRGAGKAGHPTLEISRRLVSRSPNITRLLDKLIDKGLARRSRDEVDRRRAIVHITREGEALLGRCDREVDAILRKLRCLQGPEMERLVGFLDRVRSAVAVPTVREELLDREGTSPDR